VKLIAQIEGLSPVVTLRGVPPSVPGAVVIDDLPKLEPGPARDAFLAISGDVFSDDLDLPHLLEALDGHALSIRLVAAQAVGLPSLAGLRQSWEEAHAEILKNPGEKESRLTSVRASLALSLSSRRMNEMPLARRLLAIIAFLPGGLAEEDVRSLLGDRGTLTSPRANDAVTCLHQLRLVERRADSRLRMLTPLRESVRVDVQTLGTDQDRLISRYLAIAAKGRSAGTTTWDNVRVEVEAEAANLDPVCLLAAEAGFTNRKIQTALGGLAEFHRATGRGSVQSLGIVAQRLSHEQFPGFFADCLWSLGAIASSHSDFDTARTLYDEALSLYRRVDDVVGEASCIRSFGEIAQMRSELDTAGAHYDEALAAFRRKRHVVGEAYCIFGLGDIARMRSEYDIASTFYDEALGLFRRVGNVNGEANCICCLGSIAFSCSDHESAWTRYDEALGLNRRIGDVIGEANCIFGLGEIARMRSDHGTAGTRYDEALGLYRRRGDVGSEARATICRGQARQKSGEPASGRADIEAGFELYFQSTDVADLALPGWRAMFQALTKSDTVDETEQREIARSLWTAIGRLDLVHDWIDLRT